MAAVTTSFPDHYTTQWDSMWRHLAQQQEARLREYVTVDSIVGKERTYNHMASTIARLITTRKGATTETVDVEDKRWLRLQGFDEVSRFDEFDEILLGQTGSPAPATVRKHQMAFNRRMDQTIIDALGGTAYNGVTGTDAIAFPVAQEIYANYKDATTTGDTGEATGANYNLTMQKIIHARKLLEASEAYDPMYGDSLCMAVSAAQIEGMLQDAIEVQSSDFSPIKALYEGTISTFAGFHWKRTELLTSTAVNAGGTGVTCRDCFAWVKSGVVLGIGQDRKVYADVLPELNHSKQIRTTMMLGATRLQEVKVVKIRCDETAASTV